MRLSFGILSAVGAAIAMSTAGAADRALIQVSANTRAMPVYFGPTEELVFVDEIPPQAREVVLEAFGDDCRVGYHFHGFCFLVPLNLWTWSGQFVIYHNERMKEYWTLDDEQWRGLLQGQSPEVVWDRPFSYSFPPGLVLIGVLAIGGFVTSKWKQKAGAGTDESESRQFESISADPRFEQAVDVYMHACEDDEDPLLVIDHAVITAVEYLVQEAGVEPTLASEGLLTLLRYFALERADELRAEAVQAEHAKEYEDAFDAYSEAAELVRQFDEADSAFLARAAARMEKRIE